VLIGFIVLFIARGQDAVPGFYDRMFEELTYIYNLNNVVRGNIHPTWVSFNQIWSLSIEEQFYVVVPLLIGWVPVRTIRPRQPRIDAALAMGPTTLCGTGPGRAHGGQPDAEPGAEQFAQGFCRDRRCLHRRLRAALRRRANPHNRAARPPYSRRIPQGRVSGGPLRAVAGVGGKPRRRLADLLQLALRDLIAFRRFRSKLWRRRPSRGPAAFASEGARPPRVPADPGRARCHVAFGSKSVVASRAPLASRRRLDRANRSTSYVQ
jgi:hypothetical protein